jgi:hypothetical protein
MPPIDVYRIGKLHFVEDGHHRVSVACALGDTHIDAYVKEIQTALGADTALRLRDLPLKKHERVLRERVRFDLACEIGSSSRMNGAMPSSAAWLRPGDFVPATLERLLSRPEVAHAWFHEEYEPVVQALNEAHAGGEGTETERYLRIAMLRYLLLQTHGWSDDVVERLLCEVRQPSAEDDTMVHQILTELRQRPSDTGRRKDRPA